jgi:cyclophilin family peptidyl-prolyl cis-trans isomerase/HEAT repeat protein
MSALVRASRLGGLLIVGAAATACKHPAAKVGADAAVRPVAAGALSKDEEGVAASIDRAEDQRRAAEVLGSWQTSGNPALRRRAVRALARIAEAPIDPATEAALLRALGDEDLEVAGWAAYGLGWACKGREEEHVKALAARATTLADTDASAATSRRDAIDAPAAIARAMGRCGGPLAEGTLTSFVRGDANDRDLEEVVYAFGSISARGPLGDEAMGALLDRALAEPASAGAGAALYPIGRLDRVPSPWTARVLGAARAVLAAASPLRGMAVRALEKAGPEAISDLVHVASSAGLDPAERAEAARALGRLGPAGREGAASVLARMEHDRALLEPATLSSDAFNVLVAVVGALGQEAPRSADAALRPIASLPLAGADAPGLSRRVVTLRCAAAAALAQAAYDAELLARCDPDAEGAIGQRARLGAITQRPIVTDRRKAFRALAMSPHVSVREAALEAIAQHPELEDVGRTLLVQALGATEPGVVASAAEAIAQHPERVLTLARSERLAALDPRAPPPSAHPAMDLPAEVATALAHALGRGWRDDAVETRTSLLDAAVAVNVPEARAAATRACADPNVTVRQHATRALRSLGTPQAACPRPATPEDAPGAPASPPPVSHPVRVTFEIEAAKLAIVFEPELAPRAASRFVALSRAGFYRGIVVHRVVPGYVVQFGDPGGDGYGGSGDLLRCETSPVAFGPLDVGVALAGRDTGSSQVFVTLARYPKLDGEYARVGHAEGDWASVAEGDVITGVSVEE